MLPNVVVAAVSVVLLAAHFIVNVRNIATRQVSTGQSSERATIRASQSPYFYLALFGTLVLAVDSVLLPLIAFTGLFSFLNSFPFRIDFQFDLVVQIVGLVILTSGYLLFWWSVIARGKYAVSWDMPGSHKLVTWGPYHYVRHPSYLAYSLMFIGLVCAWLNLLAAPCLMGVPGYYLVTYVEEKILVERFGDEYRAYQKKTGRFFPHLKPSGQ